MFVYITNYLYVNFFMYKLLVFAQRAFFGNSTKLREEQLKRSDGVLC